MLTSEEQKFKFLFYYFNYIIVVYQCDTRRAEATFSLCELVRKVASGDKRSIVYRDAIGKQN